MEAKWLKDSLFNGLTSNGWKLGLVLSQGWFWYRIGGITVLYRGQDMEKIDFTNILTLAAKNAGQIQPPVYVEHESNSTYYYVVRMVNNCGDEEQTMSAAVKVSLGDDGELKPPRPNNIFELTAKQSLSGKVRLLWFYYPLDQKSVPECFNIYTDNGTGKIDYGNAIGTIDYAGLRFYEYYSMELAAGEYLFAVRAVNAGGIEDESSARICLGVDTACPRGIKILSAKAI
ncbi:MAG: hypothetical protein NTW55_08025 [Planctomycetota bacterium]|nr:hypothetical protein [Planctomycetota bacterium]